MPSVGPISHFKETYIVSVGGKYMGAKMSPEQDGIAVIMSVVYLLF